MVLPEKMGHVISQPSQGLRYFHFDGPGPAPELIFPQKINARELSLRDTTRQMIIFGE
jgi:hypothetical protein